MDKDTDTVKSWFKSDALKAKDQLAEKRIVIAEKLAAAKAKRADRLVEWALSPDPFAFHQIDAEIAGYEHDLANIAEAIAELDRLEEQRQQQKAAELRKSQNRAIAQHLGRVKRAAERYQVAVENEVSAFRELISTGEVSEKLLPPEDDWLSTFRNILSAKAISDACDLERARQGRDCPYDAAARPPLPGTEGVGGSSWYPLNVTPLVEALSARLKSFHARLIGKTEPTATPLLTHQPEPAAEPEPIHPSIRALDPFLTRAEPEETPPVDPQTLARNRSVAGLDPMPTEEQL